MKLYYSIMSTFAQKAMLAFYEKGIDFTPSQVNLYDPALLADYKKIYPLGKIPLLTDDNGLFIPEATIIIEYLEHEYKGQGTRLIPDDPKAARHVRYKDRVADLYINTQISDIYFDSTKPDEKKNPDAMARAHEILELTFTVLEKELASQEFVAGDTFSMADCATFPPLFYAQQMHPYADKPNLTAYFQRLCERDSGKKILAELIPFWAAMNKKD